MYVYLSFQKIQQEKKGLIYIYSQLSSVKSGYKNKFIFNNITLIFKNDNTNKYKVKKKNNKKTFFKYL